MAMQASVDDRPVISFGCCALTAEGAQRYLHGTTNVAWQLPPKHEKTSQLAHCASLVQLASLPAAALNTQCIAEALRGTATAE